MEDLRSLDNYIGKSYRGTEYRYADHVKEGQVVHFPRFTSSTKKPTFANELMRDAAFGNQSSKGSIV